MEINLFNSDANCLSCKPLSFDLIICINAIHHFNYKIKFIEDSIKLLKKNGVLCIIGLDPRDDKNDWYLYKYFTRTYGLDLERFPSFQQLHEVMKNNGFINIYQKFVHKVESQKIGNEVLKDHFLDKRGASQLALLTDEEYQVGITKIKKDIEEAEKASRKIVFKTLLNFYSILGIKN
jgi:ubiquinone/menaquinone biosynthesis C-methylase UbiE